MATMIDTLIAFHATSHPGATSGSASQRVDVALEDQSGWSAIRSTWPAEPRFAGLTHGFDAAVGPADAVWKGQHNVVWDYDRDWADGVVTPGFKQVSLVRRRPDISAEEFRERYLGHGEVAKVHHGVWKYAQNVDLQLVDGGIDDGFGPVDGISELWFESYEALRDRFYARADSVDVVREDTSRFLDFASTYSVLVNETIVRS